MSDVSEKVPIRRRLSPEARRAQLLDTAIDVFAEMGLERAGHGEVAKRAGVSTATVFNYFPTRDELVQAVLEQIESIVDKMLERVPPNCEDAEDCMLALAAAYTDLVINQPAAIKTFLKWSVCFDPDLRKPWLDYQSRTLDKLVAYMPPGPDARTEARILFGSANMLAIMAFDHKEPDDIQAYVRRMAKVLAGKS